MTLALTKGSLGEGVVEDIRKLLGPKDVEKAKEEDPDRCAIIACRSNAMALITPPDEGL